MTLRYRVWLASSAVLVFQAHSDAQTGPQPPCGNQPVPPYPALEAAAIVKSWSKADLGHGWTAPGCVGWTAVGFSTLVTVSARFRYTAGGAALLRHIGAISELAGMRYWSTTHHQWQTLIVAAHALTGASGRRRADFTQREINNGKTLFFEQEDNVAGKAIYRMHIVDASPDHLVFDVENVNTIRRLLVPIFRPGEMQSIYFMDRESDDVWRYYSILRLGKNANGLVTRNESSSINRAVAFYRHFAGISGILEPPAARSAL